jgi:hypothetical protein
MDTDQSAVLNAAIAQLTPSELGTLGELSKVLPLVADHNDSHEFISTRNLCYTDCYINAMVESDYDTPFLTEKSLKPYFSGQFSAVLGNNRIYDHLTDLGVDTMQDYLDLSTDTGDFGERVDQTLHKVSALLPNIEQVWHDTYERRLYNYNYVRSVKFTDKMENKIKQWLI